MDRPNEIEPVWPGLRKLAGSLAAGSTRGVAVDGLENWFPRLCLPHFLEILESSQIVLLLQPALHSELRENHHHLSQREPGKFSGPAEGGLPLLVPLYRKQDSAASHHIPHCLGQITPLFFCDLVEEFIVAAVHADAHGLAHCSSSNSSLAFSNDSEGNLITPCCDCLRAIHASWQEPTFRGTTPG